MYRFLAFILGYCCVLATQASAGQPEYEISTSYVSEYNDRGTTVAGEQIWTSVSVSFDNFSAGLNYASSLGEGRKIHPDEIDLNINYGFDISDLVQVNIGADIINDPASGGFFDIGTTGASTIEVYSSLSFDTFLQPNITAFYDIHLRDFILEGTVEHGISISENTVFIPSLKAGYAAIANNDNNSYLTASIAIENQIGDRFTVFANSSFGTSSRHSFSDFKSLGNPPLPLITNSASSIWAQIGISSQF